ncbi:MAG TPA: MBL fold metallo-hydrolase [Candidatus Thermoplasmatota archaeon]|nr:MBL fold metallo-hydrolase [Candidatus Thermoplasmatota archaeon]
MSPEWPRDFNDRQTAKLPGARDMLRILRSGGFKGRGKPQLDAHRVPRMGGPLPPVPSGGIGLTWIGHATYLVRLGGLNILTDPVYSAKLPGGIPRLVPPGIAFEDLPPIDAVVVSHNHYDHLDAKTLRRLGPSVHYFVPAKMAPWFRRKGLPNVTEMDWWDATDFKGVRFTFVPAHHWTRRGLTDTNKTLWGGWVLAAGGRGVHFAGDTAYGSRFREVGERVPDLEVSLMPIGAYEPRWFMRNVHLDPDEAVQAVQDLGARRMATMHWGTFVLTQEPLMEPLARVRAAWERAGLRREDLLDLAIGESRVL